MILYSGRGDQNLYYPFPQKTGRGLLCIKSEIKRVLPSPYVYYINDKPSVSCCAWLSFAIMNADTMSLDVIQARLDELQKEIIRKANSKQDYNALRCASRNHRPRQIAAAARRHRNASLRRRTSSEASNPKSANSTKASSVSLSNRFTVEFKSGITIAKDKIIM